MSASKIRRGTRVLGDDFPTTRVPNDDTATLSHVTHKTRRDRDANQRPQEPELTSRWAHATWQPPPREPVTPRDFRRTQRRGVGRAVAGRRVSDILGSVEDQPLPGHELRPRGGASVLTSSGIWRAPPEPPPPRAVVPTRQPPGAGSSGPPTAVRPFTRFSLGQTFRPSNLQSPVFPGAPVPSAAWKGK